MSTSNNGNNGSPKPAGNEPGGLPEPQSASNPPITTSSVPPPLSPISPGAIDPISFAVASILLERHRFADLTGFNQFGDARKLFNVLGYPSTLTFDNYNQRFWRGGIAKRIVQAHPSLMGWGKVQLVENEKDLDSDSPFESTWKNLFKRLSIGSIFKRADIMAGVGEYSCIYIGVKEKIGVKLSSEMSKLNGPDDIVYLRPLNQSSCEIVSQVGDVADDDPSDERYGMPKTYKVKINGSNSRGVIGQSLSSSTMEKEVHWSRIIHITHEPLESELFSAPVLESVWNYLMDLDKVVGGGSEAVWRQAVQRTLFDLDQNIGPDQIDPATKDKLKSDLEDMMHNMKEYAFTRGVTPKSFGSDEPVQFGENVKTIISLIAATLDLPQRRILGSETAYASADQDKNTEEENIQARQEEFGTCTVRKLADRLIAYNGLPKPVKYDVIWPVEEKKKLKQKVSILREIGLANQAQSQADGTLFITNDEARDMVFDMDPIESEIEPENEEVLEDELEREPIVEPTMEERELVTNRMGIPNA